MKDIRCLIIGEAIVTQCDQDLLGSLRLHKHIAHHFPFFGRHAADAFQRFRVIKDDVDRFLAKSLDDFFSCPFTDSWETFSRQECNQAVLGGGFFLLIGSGLELDTVSWVLHDLTEKAVSCIFGYLPEASRHNNFILLLREIRFID
ncbi:hypothetical protein SDC9_112481 [bioreactor metagenome]|uniref:Uncharacterized protein n=1 Tax=bioreactor metagenome TaxID=1076179 RepID=A0A645BUY3_9ZZZZ